jgi:hypothetical protein
MSTITARRLRLACNLFSFDGPKDKATGQKPILWCSNDYRIEIAAFNGTPAEGTLVSSFANIASITCELKAKGTGGAAPTPGSTPLASATIVSPAACTYADWIADLAQHAVFEFSSAEMNQTAADVWLVISAETTDAPAKTITLLAGEVTLREDGYNSAGTAPVASNSAYTKAEADARYVKEYLVPMDFAAELTDEQTFGYFKARSACRVLGAQLFAQVAPVGAAVTVDLINGAATEQTKVATLADGVTHQETIYGTPLELAAGDVIRAKIKSVGVSTKGEFLTCNLIIAPAV